MRPLLAISREMETLKAMKYALMIGLVSLFQVSCFGTLINLTSTQVEGLLSQTEVTIGDGEFINSSYGSAGSGTLQRWYGLEDDNDADEIEYGYNYDGSGSLPFDMKPGGVMDPELYLGDLNTTNYNGNDYYEFVLDTNENDGFISLDSFKLFVYDDPNTSPYVTDRSNLGDLGDLVYDMDETIDYSILLEEQGSGGGSTDLTVLIDKDVFNGYSGDSKIYLFSEFGASGTLTDTTNNLSLNFGANGGFEEWGFRKGTGVIPEASTYISGSTILGVCILFAYLRRKKN